MGFVVFEGYEDALYVSMSGLLLLCFIVRLFDCAKVH